VGGGVLKTAANAWPASVVWGAPVGADGDSVVWGTRCAAPECDDELWGALEVETHEWGAADAMTATVDGGMLEYLEPVEAAAALAGHDGSPGVERTRLVQAAVLPGRLRSSRGRVGASRV
jgi:hypothetical protein